MGFVCPGGRLIVKPNRLMPFPRSAEARTSLIVSWLVLAYLLASVIVATLMESGLSALVRASVIVVVAAISGYLLRLQALELAGTRKNRSKATRWTIILLCLFLLSLSYAWPMLSVAFVAVLFTSNSRSQALAIGTVLTGVVELIVVMSFSKAYATFAVPVITWLMAAVFYALTRMAAVLEQLRRTREHLARIQVDEERSRISRALHDILGRTLVAASLRTQTAIQLVDHEPESCRNELQEVSDAVSHGQEELRRLVRGNVATSLEQETRAAVELFERLGIEHSIDVSDLESHEISVIAASVLREAVTNMLKHCRPHSATIVIHDDGRVVRIVAVNDGVQRTTPIPARGSGLTSLADRVRRAHGYLRSGPRGDGCYQLTAEIPHTAEIRLSMPSKQLTA